MTTNTSAFKTKEITASSRASVSVNVKGNTSYYTFEASETRTVNYDALPNNLEEAEKCIEQEWEALFDTVNEKVDKQVADIVALANKTKKPL